VFYGRHANAYRGHAYGERQELLHYSGRGCQYTSDAYQKTVRALGIECSQQGLSMAIRHGKLLGHRPITRFMTIWFSERRTGATRFMLSAIVFRVQLRQRAIGPYLRDIRESFSARIHSFPIFLEAIVLARAG
jgi:transposase InsO family protein